MPKVGSHSSESSRAADGFPSEGTNGQTVKKKRILHNGNKSLEKVPLRDFLKVIQKPT